MPYLLVILTLAGAVTLHFRWRTRYRRLYADWVRERQHLETEQKRHDQAATQKAAEQQALFNSMTEGVLVLDRSGRVQLVNRSLQEFFGLKTDLRGQTMMEAFRLPVLADLAKRLPQERIVQALELELPGVRRRWLEVNAAAVFDKEGTQHGGILVFHDLTRLKQLENTRQEFVANVSHE